MTGVLGFKALIVPAAIRSGVKRRSVVNLLRNWYEHGWWEGTLDTSLSGADQLFFVGVL